jgi:LemA protein
VKKTLATILVSIVVGVLLIGAWVVGINNDLVALQEHVKTEYSQVDSALQRRYDLIPNLVETVKGYASHEKELFESVAKARSQWSAAQTPAEKSEASGVLERGLGRLIAVSEAYPELKASENFRDLQVQLEGSENRIQVARRRYNEAVRGYNTRVRQFPASLVAGFRGFTPSDTYFETSPGAREAPKVDFGSPKTSP